MIEKRWVFSGRQSHGVHKVLYSHRLPTFRIHRSRPSSSGRINITVSLIVTGEQVDKHLYLYVTMNFVEWSYNFTINEINISIIFILALFKTNPLRGSLRAK